MKLASTATLVDVAFAVCTALDRAGTVGVPTGESADITITDCVRDRFMHFWAWNDRSALELALEVARRHSERFDAGAFRAWAAAEHVADSSYPQEKVDEFFRRLAADPGGSAKATTET